MLESLTIKKLGAVTGTVRGEKRWKENRPGNGVGVEGGGGI